MSYREAAPVFPTLYLVLLFCGGGVHSSPHPLILTTTHRRSHHTTGPHLDTIDDTERSFSEHDDDDNHDDHSDHGDTEYTEYTYDHDGQTARGQRRPRRP